MAKKRTVEKNGLVYKEFQKQVSALKKAGLVPKTLDVRKVKPTKHYKGLVSKYKDIATGSAKVAAIPNPAVIETLEARGESIIKKGGKAYLKARQQINQRGQVVNPFTIRVTKRGEVIRRYKKTTPEGKPVYITQRELPIKFENMEQWLTELKAAGFQLQKGEQIYFTFNGNYSRRTYASFDEAFNKFMTYDIIIDAVAGKLKVEDEADLVKSVGFQRISGPEAAAYNRNRILLPEMQFSESAKRKYKRRQKRGYGSKGV